MRSLLAAILLLPLAAAATNPSLAQSIRIRGNVDLAAALRQISAQSGVDIVFSGDLVQGRRSACEFEGAEVADALRCVIGDSALDFEQVAPRQFVLTSRETPKVHEVSGTLRDANTGDGLIGAHVYLPGLRVGTVTGDDGSFRLTGLSSGRHRVRFSYIGYETVDSLLQVPARDIEMSLSPRSIGTRTLLVTGDSGDRAEVEAIPGVIALPVSELLEIPTSLDDQDLFQALEWLPGIERTGETAGGLVVRGSGPDHNLYLLDGAPVYHPSHAFSIISTFQTETLRDVKFYRGSFPAEHGGMLSAILDAELKDGRRTRPSATVAINALNARFMVETPITSSSSFMLSARRSYIDKVIGRTHPVEEDGRRDTLRTGYYFYDWSAKLSFRSSDRSRVTLSYYRGRDDLDLRLPFDLSLDFSSWLRPADLFFEVDHRWGNELFTARYQLVPSDKLLITFSAYESRYNGTESSFIRPTTASVVVSDYEVSLRDLGGRLELDWVPGEALSVKAGVSVVRHRFGSSLDATLSRSAGLVDDVQDGSDVESTEAVFFLQGLWKPSDRLRLQPGVRITSFEGDGLPRVNPRLSASYAIAPWLIAKLAAGTQVQHLHRLRDRYSFLYDLVSTRWIPVDSRVEPSVSGQAAFGLDAQLSRPLKIIGDVYYRSSEDVLLPRDELQTKEGLEGPGIGVSALLGEYVRASTRSYGYELTGEWQRRSWTAMLSYSGGISETKSPEVGETEYRTGRFDVPRSARAVVTRSGARWTYSASATLRVGYPETVPTAMYSLGSPLEAPSTYLFRPEPNNGRLPAYARLDVFGGYRFGWLGADWSVSLHLYNVTNRRNVLGRQYTLSDGRLDVVDRGGLPLLPLFEIEMRL